MKTGKELWKRIAGLTILLIPLLLFILWTGWWLLFVLVFLITDAHLTRIIPWKKLKLRLPASLVPWWEWTKAIFIALVLTFFLRTFLVEAYKIPTPSMENTLLTGDFLFVSKIAYGPRIPNTPLSIPFLPPMLPDGSLTYSDSWQIPYKRLAGSGNIRRFDLVVFNFPEGDTVVAEYPGQSYYSLSRQYGKTYLKSNTTLRTHPVDKRDHYIKRCIGLPGDTVLINRGEVFINGEAEPLVGTRQYRFHIRTRSGQLPDSLFISAGIDRQNTRYNPSTRTYTLNMDLNTAAFLESQPEVESVRPFIEPSISFRDPEVFPSGGNFMWTADDFGPIVVPGKGMNIELNRENLPLYERIITLYEKNKVEIINDSLYLNGSPLRSYTFGMNYYFMAGDNRHNSLDSRFWGFVPEDHVVGKAVLIWFSREPGARFLKGYRFNRMFRSIK